MTINERARTDAERGVFDVRTWLAGQLLCPRNELRIDRGGPRSDVRGAMEARYTRGSSYLAQVLIGPVKTMLDTEPPHRVLTAFWPGGSAGETIGPDDELVW